MMMLWGSPLAFLTSRKPSAPAPPPLLTVMIGCFIRLFLATTPWMKRAIWSAPPPVPAGMMNCTGLVGSQPCALAGPVAAQAAAATAASGDAADRAASSCPVFVRLACIAFPPCRLLVLVVESYGLRSGRPPRRLRRPATGSASRGPAPVRAASVTSGQNSRITPSVMIEPTSQFDQKIARLPCEPSIACRNDFLGLVAQHDGQHQRRQRIAELVEDVADDAEAPSSSTRRTCCCAPCRRRPRR